MCKNVKFIETHVEIALEEINQTMKYIIFNYTNASTHRKHYTYAFCNMDFRSSIHASHRVIFKNLTTSMAQTSANQNGSQP